jgi:hypothetical protein
MSLARGARSAQYRSLLLFLTVDTLVSDVCARGLDGDILSGSAKIA